MSAKSKSNKASNKTSNNSITNGNNSTTGGTSTGKKKTSKKTESAEKVESVIISNLDLDAEFGDTWDEPISKPVKSVISTTIEDDEFADSWNDSQEQPTIESKVNEPTVDEIDAVDSEESLTASEELAVRENEKRIEEGTALLNELIMKDYQVKDIDGSMVIRTWEDILLENDLNLNKTHVRKVISAIRNHGFETPREIQMITILRILKGGDFIGQASAGNGKTAAFGIPAILSTDPSKRAIQKMIVVPTTILAQQIVDVITELSRGTGIIIQNWSGGEKYIKDRRPHIVVGTPGRICELLSPKQCMDGVERLLTDLRHLSSLILDEGDELLKQGFREQLSKIVTSCPGTTQVCVFSATFPADVLNICNGFMTNPAQLIVPEKKVITTRVNQYYAKCENENGKLKDVIDCINKNEFSTIMIFCNTCSGLKRLSESLTNNTPSIRHLCLSGRMGADEKKLAVNDFKAGKCRILLLSNLGARGFDTTDTNIVINYDMPDCVETYVHRIGRAGRAGEIGNAVTLITTDKEMSTMKFIVQFHGMPIRETLNKKTKDVTKIKFKFA